MECETSHRECRISFQDEKIIGSVVNRRARIGLYPQYSWFNESTLNKWKIVLEEIPYLENDKHIGAAVGQYKQGAWTR